MDGKFPVPMILFKRSKMIRWVGSGSCYEVGDQCRHGRMPCPVPFSKGLKFFD